MLVQSKIAYSVRFTMLDKHVKRTLQAELFNASIIGIFGVEKIGIK
jgi:hypothetical protein